MLVSALRPRLHERRRTTIFVAFQVQCFNSLLQRWNVRAAPAAKPWPATYTSMLSKQAEMSMLNGDFEHFDEAGAELLAGKEVGVLRSQHFCAAILVMTPACIVLAVC